MKISRIFVYVVFVFNVLFSTHVWGQCMNDLTNGLAASAFFGSAFSNSSENFAAAFNNANDAGSKWYRGGLNTSVGSPNWIGANLGTSKAVTGYLISSANDFPGRNPRDWQFQGSNDGTTWVTLQTITNNSFSYAGQSQLFKFTNTTPYTHYRIYITETFDVNETGIQIGEIEIYENVCLQGTVKDLSGNPLSAVRVAILGEVYSVSGGGGNVVATTTTDALGNYFFDPSSVPNGQFSIIVEPPSGYQIASNSLPFFTNASWTGSSGAFSLSRFLYTYDGSITFQNYKQLNQSSGTTGSVFWDSNEQSNTYLNRFLPTADKSNLNFVLKRAVPHISCSGFIGSAASVNNLITIADNGTFGQFETGTVPGSYLRLHPGQPGFSKDYSNSILYGNGGLLSPANTQYTYANKANVSLGSGVLFDEAKFTVSSYVGTLADLIDGNNGVSNATSLLNVFNSGWRKTYGNTTGDVYDKFLIINGASNGAPLFIQPNLALSGGVPYLFSFDGKSANSSSQGISGSVTVNYYLLNASSVTVATGTITLPIPSSVSLDDPSSDWNQVFTTIVPPSNGVYSLQLRFPSSGALGGDFYVDNISLRSLVDNSDAPASYGSASHGQTSSGINSSTCTPLLILGSLLDVENSAPFSAAADGDNNDMANDEDGVSCPALNPGATTYAVTITATNNTASPATVYGWIDWNHDGIFDITERATVAVPASTSNGAFSMAWSTITTTGPVFARFRLSSDSQAQNPTGMAVGGEVEDYMVPLNTSMAVNFNLLSARTANGQVYVNWSTLYEESNDHFEIEASIDGKTFVKIGEQPSLAVNGSSNIELRYSFDKDISSVTGLLGVGVLLLVVGFRTNRHRLNQWVLVLATAGVMIAGFTSCVKTEVTAGVEKELFIRIKQVDKNGSSSYSKVIKSTKH